MPMDSAYKICLRYLIAELTDMIQHGQPVQVFGAPLDGVVRMTSGEEKTFIGIGEIDDDGRVAPKRLVVFRDQEQE